MKSRKSLRRGFEWVFSTFRNPLADRKAEANLTPAEQDGFQRFMDEWCKQLQVASPRSLSEK
jgi:hypothetical protein